MRRGFVLTLVVVALAWPAGRASAHAELTGSTPADGAVVTEPLAEIVLTFSEGVEPTAAGFAVTVDGVAVEQVATSPDGAVWVLSLDPVTAGTVAVAYDVVSADGHLITGELAFTVDAPPPTTAAAPLTSAPPSAPTTVAPPVATNAAAPPTSTPAVATTPRTTTTEAPEGTASTIAAADTDGGGSDAVLWVIVIAGGVVLLAVLAWGAARRSRP
jgi:methionine-rich copper-binding protein CopC